jgi:hypothetical protein
VKNVQMLDGAAYDDAAERWGIRSLDTGLIYAWGTHRDQALEMLGATGAPLRYELVVKRSDDKWIGALMAAEELNHAIAGLPRAQRLPGSGRRDVAATGSCAVLSLGLGGRFGASCERH